MESVSHFDRYFLGKVTFMSPLFTSYHVKPRLRETLTLSYPRGGHYGPPYHESVCRYPRVRIKWTNFLTLFLSVFARLKKASFGVCFLKNWKIGLRKFLAVLEHEAKIRNFEFFYFFASKPYFFKLNLNCKCSQLSFEVHNTLETQNFENFEFFYYNINWNLTPSSN